YLDAAIGRVIVANDDACAWIATQMPRFAVAGPGHPVKAAVAPLVPDGREQHRAVTPVGREDGQERQLQQVSQVLRRQPLAHAPNLPGRWRCRLWSTPRRN